MIKSPYALTPVELHEGLLLKRDDLFQPFGENTVNGGKLRQCYMLIESVKDHFSGVISCCSIYSPQAPITSAVARNFSLKCVICYGGTTYERLKLYRMPTICRCYGAKIRIISKSGIHRILYNKAKKIAQEEKLFVVDYGFNITNYSDILLSAVSDQVKNIPEELDNLVITCGSGITTIGIIVGLHKFHKKVKKIYLVCTAPNRDKLIQGTIKRYGIKQSYTMVDLFHLKGFKYEVGVKESLGDIEFHPNYEAKAYRWLKNNLNYKEQKTLLWIVGSKPMK